MLRICLIAILLLAWAFTAAAQQPQFGLKAGYNASWLHSTVPYNTNESKVRSAFHAGVFYSVPLGQRWGAQADLLYAQVGDRYTSSGGSATLDAKT
jgi:hypothetical protein